METPTIKTPADVLSFIGHTFGFWPQESNRDRRIRHRRTCRQSQPAEQTAHE